MTLRLDVRGAWRVVTRTPGTSLLIVATLALCLGANAAIFSVVDATLFRPLPYPDPNRLARVVVDVSGRASGTRTHVNGATWETVRDHAAGLDAAVYSTSVKGVNATAGAAAAVVEQQRVGAGFFRVLGVAPQIGREFTREEDVPGGPPVAVLSHGFWQRAFDGDAGVVGRAIALKGEPHTVVGVMPEGFATDVPAEVWTPLRPSRALEGSGQNYAIVARVPPGPEGWVDAERGLASLTAAALPPPPEGITVRLALVTLQEGQTQGVRTPLLILWGAVGLVLLIGCANVAGLLLAGAASRTREVATRMALGGGRRAVVRQLLVESLILSLAGGAAGLALGFVIVDVLGGLAADQLLPIGPARLDLRVVGAAFALTLATSLVAGLFPAFEASRVDLRSALGEGGSRAVAGAGRHWSRRLLVAGEIALAVMLLVGAGLLVRSLSHFHGLAPGFDPQGVLAASVSLDDARYAAGEAVVRLLERGVEDLSRAPGVESAAAGLSLPFERGLNMPVVPPGAAPDADPVLTNLTYVTSDYFRALRIPVLRGRAFTAGDGAGAAPVAIVNDAFARRYVADDDPLGRQVRSGGIDRTIVGVVGTVQQSAGWGGFGPLGPIPSMYVPAAQMESRAMQLVHTWFAPSWVVRSAAPPATVARDVDAVLRRLDPQLPVSAAQPVDRLRGRTLAWQRFQASLLASLAGLAVLLAATGIYGMMAQSVVQRRRELGIRLALGATLGQAVRDAAVPGLLMAVAGVAGGCALAMMATRVLQGMLWGVTPTDPLTYVAAVTGLLAVAVVATLVPALRITQVDPAETLREG